MGHRLWLLADAQATTADLLGLGQYRGRQMLFADDLRKGHIVRLTMPYGDAERGIYTVVYMYRNGWLGVVSHSNGRQYDVPRQVCRQVEIANARVN